MTPWSRPSLLTSVMRHQKNAPRELSFFLVLMAALLITMSLLVTACGGNANPSDVQHVISPTDLGREHLNPGQRYNAYNSIPPTSGPHDPNPLRCGIYSNSQRNERFLHTMEHGAVVIGYQADLLSRDQLMELQILGENFLSSGKRIVMLPIESLAVPIAVASWGNLLNLREVDVGQIEEFVSTFENKGPEKFPRSNAC